MGNNTHFYEKFTKKELTKMTKRRTITYPPTYRAKRGFAAVFCQFFSAKNIPKSKDRHVHGSSPPVSAAVYSAFPSGLDPGG